MQGSLDPVSWAIHWLESFVEELYSHIHAHAGYIPTQWITDEWSLLYKNIYLSLYLQGSKGLCGVLLWEGVGDRTETAIFWPPLLWPSTLCLSRSPDAQPEAQRPTLLGDLLHLILNFSRPQLIRAPRPQGLMWLSLPHLVYNSISNSTVLTSVLTELYNGSTPTQSPTRSLERHDWSSSSGNNCYAVQRSLSSGASVYESIMGFFTFSHFISQFPPMRFPLITAVRMYHFLPVHHLEWHFWLGRRSKYNRSLYSYLSLRIVEFSLWDWSTTHLDLSKLALEDAANEMEGSPPHRTWCLRQVGLVGWSLLH